MMCLARAASPGRAFAVYATVEIAIATVVAGLLPSVIAAAGGRAPFVAIAVIAAAALLFVRVLPPFVAATGAWSWRRVTALPAAAWWATLALFLYFAGQGALWTFLEPIGKSQLIPPSGIVRALTLINVAGLVGSFGVGALAHRARPLWALCALLIIGSVSVLALFNAHTPLSFIAASCGFYFAWCASFPFQFTLIARADSSGAASAAVPAVDALGLASGAAAAGWCLPHVGVAAAGWFWAVGSIVGICCFAIAASRRHPVGIAPAPDLSAVI
jgi:predicted MFS family arabinose efflux permease